MHRSATWLVLVLGIAISGRVAAQDWRELPEIEARQQILELAATAYRTGSLEELDARIEGFARNSVRTGSGLWVAGLYYDGVKRAAAPDRRRTEDEWDALERQTLAWTRQRPASALARGIHADVIIARAWQIRGGAYAHEVPDGAWKPFHDGLRRAEAYLLQEADVAGKLPTYYMQQVVIGNGLGKPRAHVDALLDECEQRHPGFYPMYFAVLNYLLPKWHGDADEIEGFARDAVRRTQAHEGDSMYARIYWYAAQGDYKDSLFFTSNVQWALMKRGFEDIVARYPDQWNYQNYAHFACMAADTPTLTRLLAEHVGPDRILDAWGGRDGLKACERLAGYVDA